MNKNINYELDYCPTNPVEINGLSNNIVEISFEDNTHICKKTEVISEKALIKLQHENKIMPINGLDGYAYTVMLYANKDNTEFYLCEDWEEGGFAMSEQDIAENPDGPYCAFWGSKTIVTHYIVCDK